MRERTIRQPAVAGQFYPADREQIRSMIRRYLDAASLPADLGRVRAVITPHAGYIYSGPTAAYAFKALAQLPARRWTVFLLGPAHRVYFRGVALGNYTAFRTPLGDVPVAVERVAEMLSRAPLYLPVPEAHVPEHCLEVEIPFLQMVLPDFQLVPMLFGDVDPIRVGQDLIQYVGEDDLIVVSSDLSHFYPYDQARQLDKGWLEALLSEDEMAVLHGEACGKAPATALMEVARHKGWRPHLLDYRTSGDTAGDKGQVVGYASVVYTGPD